MLIKLLKEWKSGKDTFDTGQVLDVDDEIVAKSLISDEIAELHIEEKEAPGPEPKDGDNTGDDVTNADKSAGPDVTARLDALEVANKTLHTANQTQAAELARLNQIKSKRPKIVNVKDRLKDDPNGGFRSLGHFIRDCKAACRSKESSELRTWNGTVKAAGTGMAAADGWEGGYTLPPAFSQRLNDRVLENSVVRPLANKMPMTSRSANLIAVDDTDHSSSLMFGGMAAYWKSEEKQLTETRPAFTESELTLHKLTVMGYVSGEMLDWSPESLDSWLPDKMIQTAAWKEDDGFISGSGAGQPLGILNCPCVIEQAAEVGQTADSITFENVINMKSRVWRGGGSKKLLWIANRTIEPWLYQLNMKIGTAGESVSLFRPPATQDGTGSETLAGIPITFTEKASAAGTVGDLVLVNLDEYYIGDATAKNRTDRSMGLKFDYDQVAYKVIMYTGGTCPWRTTFQPKNGDTLAPIVTLATR